MAATGTPNNILNQNSLSIRIYADGFSFYYTDASTSTVWSRKDYHVTSGEEYEEAFRQSFSFFLGSKPEHVNIISEFPSTRIPLEEFRREDLADLYQVVYRKDCLQGKDICYTILPELEVVELFTIPKGIRDIVFEAYPTAIIKGATGIVLERMKTYEQGKSSSSKTFYTFITERTLLVFCLEANQLVYANNFQVNSISEVLYFMLYAWQTLGLDAEKDNCWITGEKKHRKDLVEAASKYLRNINIIEETDNDFQTLY